MKTLSILFYSAFMAACLVCFTPWYSYSASDPLNVGIFPRRNSKISHTLFTPMADYLSKKLSRPVSLETSKNFNDFRNKLSAKQFDIVHLNQYHYVVARKHYDYKVFGVNSESGMATISGSILVQKDSGIQSIMDLKVKKLSLAVAQKP